MEREIIAFIGVIGSGKDYQTKKAQEARQGSKILGFSDGVREFTWNILGWKPSDDREYEYFKDNRIMVLNGYDWPAIHTATGRKLLENVADQMRRYDSEFWGKYWMEKAKTLLTETDCIIVPDCRHKEEARKIITLATHLGIKYTFYFCDYKSDRYEIRDHSSEWMAQLLISMGAKDGTLITHLVKRILLH